MAATAAQPSDAARGRAVTLAGAAEFLSAHDDFLLVSHVRPDGDCVGSMVGLALALESLGKRVACYNVSAPLGPKLNFLEGAEKVSAKLPEWTPRCTVFVDCGAIHRVGEGFTPMGPSLNIDHHLSNEGFGDLNYIDIDVAAVGEQVWLLCAELGVEVTPPIASAIYLSVMADTGSFKYSNTTGKTLALAGKLAELGADVATIASAHYESRDFSEMKLSGIALSRLTLEFDGALVWGEILRGDYLQFGGEDAEPEGLVNEMRQILGVQVSMLIHERPSGGARVGFRGKGMVDVAAIAAELGGGGHFNAAGAVLPPGDYQQIRQRILEIARRHMAAAVARRNGA
ncbi:MAG: bifunctional oligoribonuclease/PAP phosphatase NrnA [Candidatus Sumerlaeia bacterium]|nr:bifunctional oligoribonuclease/PAP phosphatase NrnA [Candidatus Sumerlaeia bacterium]